MKKLRIYIDFKSVDSYFAFHQTEKITAKYSVDIEWWPFLIKTRQPLIKKNSETRGETHHRIRENHKRQMQVKYAHILGLPLYFRSEEHSTDLALSMLLGPRNNVNEYIKLSYDYFWRQKKDLNNPVVVENLLTVSNSPAQLLINKKNLTNSLLEATDEAKNRGIIGVPAYEIEDAIFIGREHLPWIRGMLST